MQDGGGGRGDNAFNYFQGDYFSMNTEVSILTKKSIHKLLVKDFHSYL